MGDLVDAVEAGDHYRSLCALRDLLAERLEDTQSVRDSASLAKQLRDTLNEIAGMVDTTEGSILDELASRRSQRRSAAT